MPLDDIDRMAIEGDVDVNSVIVQPNHIQFNNNYIRPIEIRNPPIPYITPINRCESGLAISLSG